MITLHDHTCDRDMISPLFLLGIASKCMWPSYNTVIVYMYVDYHILYLNLTGNPPYSGTKGNLVHSYSLRNHSATRTCLALLAMINNMSKQMNKQEVNITVYKHVSLVHEFKFLLLSFRL